MMPINSLGDPIKDFSENFFEPDGVRVTFMVAHKFEHAESNGANENIEIIMIVIKFSYLNSCNTENNIKIKLISNKLLII